MGPLMISASQYIDTESVHMGYVPHLRQRTVEDDKRDVLGLGDESVDVGEEAVRGLIVRALDVPAVPVVVSHVHDAVVLPGDLVALDDLCEFLRECASRTERAGESALRLGEERLI